MPPLLIGLGSSSSSCTTTSSKRDVPLAESRWPIPSQSSSSVTPSRSAGTIAATVRPSSAFAATATRSQ